MRPDDVAIPNLDDAKAFVGELDKLDGSRKQEVTKDAVTGLYEKKENKGPEDYTTTEEHLSPWQKEWRNLGMLIEANGFGGSDENLRCIDSLTVNAVIHVQVLKRP